MTVVTCGTCAYAEVAGSKLPCRECMPGHKKYLRANGGYWVGDYCPYKCSICGHYVDSKTPYCPYCGSKNGGN